MHLTRTARCLLGCTALALLLGLGACANSAPGARAGAVQSPERLTERLEALPASEVLLLGEQHDAPEHQQLQARIVAHLAGRGELAALVMEMAPRGGSTRGLPASAGPAQVRDALRWDERAWPWGAYGPAVMAAVRAGVPVLGGNLPVDQLRASMGQAQLESRLSPQALARQQDLMREGHCRLLPESQIAPMTRVQIARDVSMAEAVASALPQARPGQRVVLIAGSVHADRALGVPLHLPAGVRSTALRLQAGGRGLPEESFDQVLATPEVPPVDHCAGLAERFKPAAKP